MCNVCVSLNESVIGHFHHSSFDVVRHCHLVKIIIFHRSLLPCTHRRVCDLAHVNPLLSNTWIAGTLARHS